MPAMIRAMNRTATGIGFLIAQAEILSSPDLCSSVLCSPAISGPPAGSAAGRTTSPSVTNEAPPSTIRVPAGGPWTS
jgi:hypothetical protein